jgi:O-antigen/teichoic acid export membrane protein
MHAARKIAKNTLFIFSARGLEAASNLFNAVLIARYLGVEDFGRFSLLLAIGWILFPFLLLGLPRILCREIAQRRDTAADYTGTALALNGLSVIPVVIIAAMLSSFFKLEPRMNIALLLLFISLMARVVREIFASVFIAFEQMEYDTLSTFASRALELLSVVAVIYFDLGFVALLVAQIVANIAGLSITSVILKTKFVMPRIQFNKDRMLYLLKESMPLTIVDFSMLAFMYVDILVLKTFTNDIQVGLFQVSQKLLLGLLPIPNAFAVAILPFLSSLASSELSRDRLASTYSKIFKITLILGLFIAIPVIVFAHDVIRILFDTAYLQAVISLQIVLFSTPFLFVNIVTRATLVALNQQRYLMVTGGIFVLVNLVLDLVLVPRYGYVGASIATLSASVVLAGTNVVYLVNRLRTRQIVKVITMPVLVAVVIGMLLSRFTAYHLAAVIPAYLFVFFIALYLLKIFTLEEIQVLKQFVVRKTA